MGCCLVCSCCNCWMDSYLHFYVRTIENANFKGDINITGSVDVAIRFRYKGYLQDSKILNNEKKTMVFNEPIILENAAPNGDGEEDKLMIEVWDVDTATADDMLAVGELELPTQYGVSTEGINVDLKKPDGGGEVIGTLSLAQIHFIKQKLRRYMGPCKCCCCCLEKGIEA
eukprot:CAMPEP_0202685860 /NCGR_PEP_ID=MMETSP1385-20130828/1696_1 /ASSEMBLY_ACC=CAM_ASM_000861 /TAXON_ID=933848 /ORGANISM="Elphidium margaritaceum" /LENGTH=170 /DNA_ID=CAMNT_0049340321 /DNA_START=110 /DNA_END=622 /DNA_ORIENTATION=-